MAKNKKKAAAKSSTPKGFHRAVPIILFAVAVFTMFCYITQDIGALGHAISALFLGLFSVGAYAIPLLLALHAIFYYSDVKESRLASRIIFSLIAITFISALAYSITYWNGEFVFNAAEFFKNGQKAVGGGFIGGIVGFCTVKIIGRVGLVIVAAAILAVYVTYFFSKGEKGLLTVLKPIIYVLAVIERGVFKAVNGIKNAKEERIKRNAGAKNLELIQDEFFAVDNGMKTLSVSALGIRETKPETAPDGRATLQNKMFHKSAVSEEEAEYMRNREALAEILYREAMERAAKEAEEAEEPSDRRRRVIPTFDEFNDTEDEPKAVEQTVPTAYVQREERNPDKDLSADALFNKDFDPFDIDVSQHLAAKSSSRSLLDEQPAGARVKEDISELSEAELEREKRIREFERRKAMLVNNANRSIPVNNGGEFTGTPKNVDFREQKDERVESPVTETPVSSFTFDKKERVFEAPKAEPAKYATIGFDEGEGFSAVVTKPTVAPESKPYTSEPNPYYAPFEPKPYTPTYSEEPKRTEPKAESNPYYAPFEPKPYTPTYSEEPKRTEPKAEPNPYYAPFEPKPYTPTYSEEPKRTEPKAESNPYYAPFEPKPYTPAYSEEPRRTEPKAEPNPFFTPVNEPARTNPEPDAAPAVGFSMSDANEDNPIFTYTNEKPAADKPREGYNNPAVTPAQKQYAFAEPTSSPIQKEEYVPTFKPYEEPTAEDLTSEDVTVITLDEDDPEEPATLRVERERISDIYDEEDEELDEIPDDMPPEEECDDDSDEEIPPEEQNPVVHAYKDMFAALRSDEPEEEPEDEPEEEPAITVNPTVDPMPKVDPEPVTSDDEPYEEEYEEDEEDDDTLPFIPTREIPAAKSKAPESKPQENEEKHPKIDYSNYRFPPLELLNDPQPASAINPVEINEKANILLTTLEDFGIKATFKDAEKGPRITRYKIIPGQGVRVSAIMNLRDDIQRALALESLVIQAPVPGTSAIGFDLPNENPELVVLKDLMLEDAFVSNQSKTFVVLGKDTTGVPVYADIADFPHALICGATGMGKSVCINAIIMSLLYRAKPDEVKLIMIDPKRVEFSIYQNIPHLLIPVITDLKQAAGALMWAVDEMERRYDLIGTLNTRKIDEYNKRVRANPSLGEPLPKIIIIIDELADLMSQGKEIKDPVETQIQRIAQMARAAGIHLIIGTQRPSTDIITGKIKANITTRISCKVSSYIDSNTIFGIPLGTNGAENLLNNGDMLYKAVKATRPTRLQGAYLEDTEVENVTNFVRDQVTDVEALYDESILTDINKAAQRCTSKKSGGVSADDVDGAESDAGIYNDPKFIEAVEIAISSQKISTSLLQRKLSIGYGKAAKYIDAMESIGVVSEPNGQKARDVLMTFAEWEEKLSRVNF